MQLTENRKSVFSHFLVFSARKYILTILNYVSTAPELFIYFVHVRLYFSKPINKDARLVP